MSDSSDSGLSDHKVFFYIVPIVYKHGVFLYRLNRSSQNTKKLWEELLHSPPPSATAPTKAQQI